MNQILFRYCPNCTSANFQLISPKEYLCRNCGFNYFVNVATAVAAVLTWRDQLLLTVRKYPPAKGMLDLPGGFINFDESAEEGLKRELLEELGLRTGRFHYLCSYPNRYDYNDLRVHTLDLFFHHSFDDLPKIHPRDDVADAQWVKAAQIDFKAIAFSSIHDGIHFYLSRYGPTADEI
jgi:ADP-ribose pyrophosphatase YjhB (NUDIX family)